MPPLLFLDLVWLGGSRGRTSGSSCRCLCWTWAVGLLDLAWGASWLGVLGWG